MIKKSLFILAFLVFVLPLSLAQAENVRNQINVSTLEKYTEQNMEQIGNSFMDKYSFKCAGECIYREVEGKAQVEFKQQRKFLFFTINLVDVYELDDEGEVVVAKHNFWSWIFNKNKIIPEQ